MTDAETLAALFHNEPETWGLRGDPYLWREMRDAAEHLPLPESARELTRVISALYAALTGSSMGAGDVLVERFTHGGMSSGMVSSEYWRERGLPMLQQRLQRRLKAPSLMKSSWQVATAGEAFAAAQFARCGWDVSVQYGANQPEYDLMVSDGDRVLKVSVKASKDGGWGLTQSYIKNADYHSAADAWVGKHSGRTIVCLVQFRDVRLDQMPRMYLATPSEIGQWLKQAAAGRGDAILYERHEWSSRAQAAGTVDVIPEAWVFTEMRLNMLWAQT